MEQGRARRAGLPHDRSREILLEALTTAALTAGLGILGMVLLSSRQMLVVWPVLVSVAVFGGFSRVLWLRTGGRLFGELGFVYLSFALAYTLVPAVKILLLDFDIPQSFDSVLFAASYPAAEDLGTHFWRQALFMAVVAAGFLAVRTLPLPPKMGGDAPRLPSGLTIAAFSFVVVFSIGLDLRLSRSFTEYVEYYTRFEHLSWMTSKLIGLAGVLKGGGYFVVLVMLFSRYRRYRAVIIVATALICTYEVWRSLGSRIEAFTILLAVFGLYQLRVRPISVKQGAAALVVLAMVFSAVGFLRNAGYDVERAMVAAREQRGIQGSEFDAVFATSFHVYQERARGTLPPRDWRMFFWEFIAVVPFVDHISYHPQYWYARNYFPRALVPPATLGVLAESGLWGGEVDLVVRGFLNGALFAWLTRWFLRRRDRWWALTIYIYCYATCILTLKYSVLYQIIPLTRMVFPALLVAGVLLYVQAWFTSSKAAGRTDKRRRALERRGRADRALGAGVRSSVADERTTPEASVGAARCESA